MTDAATAALSLVDLHEAARKLVGHRDECFLGPVLRKDFQRFAITVGDPDPLYFDEQAARAAGYPGLIAPPMYLSAVMGWKPGPPEQELREDGLAQDDLLPVPIPGLRVMGGGQQVDFLAPVIEGAEVTMRREFTGLQMREGRSGAMLIFTVVREYVDERGDLLVRCSENFIAR